MKRVLAVTTATVLVVMVGIAQPNKDTLKTDLERTSYSLGADIGKSFKMQSMEVSTEAFVRGMKDALSGTALALSDSEMQALVMKFQQEMMAKHQQVSAKEAEANKKAGTAFLDANKKKPGVKVTASGLQYKVLKMGTGSKPTAQSTVTVHYRGMLLDGKEFDSSYKRGEPTTFPLNQVIRGWTEGLQLMPVGSKFEFWIPSDLGYGDRQMGRDITPGSTLIFEIELISVK